MPALLPLRGCGPPRSYHHLGIQSEIENPPADSGFAESALIAVGTLITERPPRSGRIEARTGLRMMPTFPRSPRSFRTAGFPQYGWKAGLSGGAFPDRQRLKPAPGMRLLTAGLPSPFVHLSIKAVVPYCAGPPIGRCTAMEGGSPSAPGALARVRVMLSRSVLA